MKKKKDDGQRIFPEFEDYSPSLDPKGKKEFVVIPALPSAKRLGLFLHIMKSPHVSLFH